MDYILSLLEKAVAVTFITFVKVYAKVLAYKLLNLLKRQKDRTPLRPIGTVLI